MTILWVIFLFLLGTCMGSFAIAHVWRFRATQKPDSKKLCHVKNDRSHCMKCGYRLRWVDLMPILSWVCLQGKCRKCKSNIGWLELTAEVALGALFVASYLLWPYDFGFWGIMMFIVWLLSLVVMTILFAYDLKWSLLPSLCLYFLLVCSVLFLSFSWLQDGFVTGQIWTLLGAIALLPGVYALLHIISKGAWVGDGDYILALSLALFLADWRLAFAVLFLANLLGSFVGIVGVMANRLDRKSRIPFGPMLIVALLIVFFLQEQVTSLFPF